MAQGNEVTDRKPVYNRMSEDKNDSVNPLYVPARPRQHHRQPQAFQPAPVEETGQRTNTLGRFGPLSTSKDTHSSRGSDLPRSASSASSQLSGSLPSVSAGQDTGIPSNKSSLDQQRAVEEPDDSSSCDSVAKVQSTLPVADTIKSAPPPPIPVRLMRLPSAAKPALTLPRVNCPEKVIICLDTSKEMDKKSFAFRQGDKTSPMELTKKALNIFLHTKHVLSSRHEFALMLLDNKAHWMCDFTSEPSRVLTHIDCIKSSAESDQCDLDSVFQEISNHISMPETHAGCCPQYIVRVILIYGRSLCLPELSSSKVNQIFQSSEGFCCDVLYVHDTPTSENSCEAVFHRLCSLDFNGNSYVLACSKNPTKMFDCMAQLLAHPLQRPLQQNTNYAVIGNVGL